MKPISNSTVVVIDIQCIRKSGNHCETLEVRRTWKSTLPRNRLLSVAVPRDSMTFLPQAFLLHGSSGGLQIFHELSKLAFKHNHNHRVY